MILINKRISNISNYLVGIFVQIFVQHLLKQPELFNTNQIFLKSKGFLHAKILYF